MDRYPYEKPPQWWSPRPNRRCIKLWRPVRRWQQIVQYHVKSIEVQGLAHLAAAVDRRCGVLVVPNHAGHADSYLLLDALERLPCDYYIMIAWQVFAMMGWISRFGYRHHGCFSVDREATDLKAYRQAVKVLAGSPDPLVIFPEGEVYHLNDRVRPFRAGTLSIAATAVRRSRRPVACVPCALKYHFLADPTRELLPVVGQIEDRLGAGPGPTALADRLERLVAATVAWRERQYLGTPQEGPLQPRLDRLADTILARLERRYSLDSRGADVPDRVKQVRQRIIHGDEPLPTDHLDARGQLPGTTRNGRLVRDPADSAALEDAFVATQLYSYAPGYILERPTIERMAETVDKLEEDVLGLRTATVRGRRRGTVRFGEPVMIDAPTQRDGLRRLQVKLQSRLQGLLDELA